MKWIAVLGLIQDPGVDPARLPLQVSDAARSIQAVVELADERAIAHVIMALGKDDVSLEVKDNRLFVKLLKEAEGSIDCIGSSGRLYRIQVIPSPQSVLRLKLRAPAEQGPNRAELPAPLQLVRAMRTGELPEGAVASRCDERMFGDAGIAIRGVWSVRFEGLWGFVCEVRNVSGRRQALDPSRFQGAGLLVVGLRDLSLEPDRSTRLYLVFGEANDE
jgi:hypothetical protein